METWQHDYLDTGEVKLHYVTQGSGPLLIMLHGFPEFWYSWRHQIPEFARDHKVVAPDLRGYGLSSRPKSRRAYTINKLMADVAALIRGMGYDKATIVAHDWGGMIAWSFAYAKPEMVERLAVLNLPHPACFRRGLFKPAQLKRSWYIFFFQLPLLPELYLGRGKLAAFDEIFRQPLLKNDSFTSADLDLYKESFSRPGALKAAVDYYRNIFSPRMLSRRWGVLEVPTLMIWGERDQALGKELTYGTEKYVRDFRIRYVPGCSHWVQQEEPALVNRYLREFLADCQIKS